MFSGCPPPPVDPLGGHDRATAVSAYALDAVATAAGVLLVASHALSGLLHWQALVFLAATYVAWGAGLRVNLRANWSLLERTGTSTNALSKAAHDLTRLRTASVRARRIASAAGYVVTELAKEVPYYAGAFGAAVVTDSVSSTDAILFLAGANLGAAGYEYGLARLTRTALRRRSSRPARPSTPTGCRASTSATTTARSSPTSARRSRTSSTPCATSSRARRSCSSGSGRRCITSSWPPAPRRRSTSPTTCPRT